MNAQEQVELAAAIAELKLTTAGWRKPNGQPSYPSGVAPASSHWGKAMPVLERLAAPPPPNGGLQWQVPELVNPTRIHLRNGSARFSGHADGQHDYEFVIEEPITDDGGIWINRVRSFTLIGGEVHNELPHVPPFELWRQIGVYLTGVRGIGYIAGIHVHGVGVGDCLQVGTGCASATIRLQDYRLESEHVTQKTGSHPDGIQCYGGGPAYWQLDRGTILSNGTIRTWQPYDSGGSPILGVDIRRANWEAQRSRIEYGTYAIWDDTQGPWWPEYHEDVWLHTDPAHDNFHGLHRNGDAPDGFTPGGYGITGEAIHWGKRPQGDFATAARVGMGYVG